MALTATTSPRTIGIALTITLLFALGLYRLGLPGGFLFDDYQNIQINPAVQPQELTTDALRAAWFGNRSGPLGRPIASVSFALDHWARGGAAEGFKRTNIVLHLLCGLALFGALRSVLLAARAADSRAAIRDPKMIALLATSLWLLHPLHASTVLYVVQRMAILAALFSLLGIWAYAEGRRAQLRGKSGRGWLLLAMPACTVLAALSKESGLLTPVLCAVCEYCFFRLRAERPVTQNLLGGLYVGIGIVTTTLLLWKHAEVTAYVFSGYQDRPFSLGERLLTQARILWWYLGLLLAPDLTTMNLYHDDFPLSKSWAAPPTTLLSVACWTVTAAAALVWAKRWPVAAFAVLFYLAGHLMESSVIALEMIFEHRNYLPSVGLFLLGSYGLLQLAATRRPLAITLVALVLVTLSVQLGVRSALFSDNFRMLLHSLRYHPDSLRTQLWAGQTYKELAAKAPPEQWAALREASVNHFSKATRLDSTDAVGLVELLVWQAETHGVLNPSSYAELIRRVSNPPIHASTVKTLQNLTRGIVGGSIRFPPEQAMELLRHLERSPGLWSEHRGSALEAIAVLSWYQGAKIDAANLYDQAQTFRPKDPYLALIRAAARLSLNQPAAARRALELARSLDHGGLTSDLELLDADISALERASGSLSTPMNHPDSAP